MSDPSFSPEQQQYLQGFVAGADVSRGLLGLPTFAGLLGNSSSGTEPPVVDNSAEGIHRRAQDRFLQNGQKLCAEEQAKRAKNPFEIWDEMRTNATAEKFPAGTDILLYKNHGLFYVAPAQNSFMCRLRIAGGITNSFQFRGVAKIAAEYGGGFADLTTRANLQIREITAANGLNVITELQEIGILPRGSGADNIRNVTGTPTAGIDRQELIDTRALCKEMHHYIVHHREMYGLPRKFNIAFDGGGTISALADTNDVGFMAVRVDEGHEAPPGVYFRLELGGITGHGDFARDTGVLLKPNECVPVAAAIVKAFSELGDRTDRKKARLKYVLDRLGDQGFLAEAEKHLPEKLRRFPIEKCVPRTAPDRYAHLGVHPQKQTSLYYVGVVLPVGRMTCAQMRGLADLADQYGSGTIRLTVWQNLLLSDIPERHVATVQREIEAMGLAWSATNVRGGLVACTGNAGCRFAAANTKKHALEIAEYLEARLEMDQPINIHLTGCHHSCAQHYIGDIGLLATKVEVGEDLVEGYHLYLGGGYGDERAIGREFRRGLTFAEIPPLIEQLIRAYQSQRLSPQETFREFSMRFNSEDLNRLCDVAPLALHSA